MLRRLFITLLLVLFAVSASAQQKKTAVQKLAKLVQPWPDEAVLNQTRDEAEHRALFQTSDPLEFTLESDFSAINKERDPNTAPRFAATLKTAGPDGQPK